jgi:hypothetical protein
VTIAIYRSWQTASAATLVPFWKARSRGLQGMQEIVSPLFYILPLFILIHFSFFLRKA